MPTPVSALLHAATMVTAGIYLLIRSQAFFIIQPNLLITMTIIGSLTAFFAASTGLTQNDIKKIIAYSTCSQLGYMFLACGLGQFSISFFHLINHAFFVRQHRYLNLTAFLVYRFIKFAIRSYIHSVWELNDGPSLRNLLKRNKSTYLFFKFKYNLKWERLMKMNSRQNCIIMIGNFYSFADRPRAAWSGDIYEKFIPEIINEGPHNTSRCSIEKISPPFLESFSLSLKIIQILKVGKQNLFHWYRPRGSIYCHPISLLGVIINNFNSWAPLKGGNKLYPLHQKTASSSVVFLNLFSVLPVFPFQFSKFYSRLRKVNLTPLAMRVNHIDPSKIDYHNKKKDFRCECKNIFKLHKSYDQIKSELNILISRYAGILFLGNSYKSLSFMKHYLRKRSWLWAKKKHKKVGKNILYNYYFKNNEFKVSAASLQGGGDGAQTLAFGARSLRARVAGESTEVAAPEGQHKSLGAPLSHSWPSGSPLTLRGSQDLLFINVEKEYQNIINKLNSLSSGGIYLFWLLDEPTKFYLGSAINLKKRFYTHYNNSLINNNHPKFYNCVKKYGWSKFGFQIVELIDDKSLLIEKENIILNHIFNNPSLMDNTLNILKFGNSWLNNKHSDKTKKLISDKMKGKKLSSLHKLKISKSLTDKKLSNETKLKISLSLKNNPNLKKTDKKYKPLVLTDKDNNIIKTFKGFVITMKELKLSQKKLKDIIDNRELYLEKFFIKYL